jgi:hypothetical protein
MAKIPSEQQIVDILHKIQPDTTGSQDRVDLLGAEFFVANVLRKYADKRYKTIADVIKTQFGPVVSDLQEQANKNRAKRSHAMAGQFVTVEISAASPVMRLDALAMYNHLLMRGVDRKMLDEALLDAQKGNAPAVSVNAIVVEHG